MTLERALALFGIWDFAVCVREEDSGLFSVLVIETDVDEDGGGARFFKHKRAATVLEALAYIAGYHSELAKHFEQEPEPESHGARRTGGAEFELLLFLRCTLPIGHEGQHMHDPSQPAGNECGRALVRR